MHSILVFLKCEYYLPMYISMYKSKVLLTYRCLLGELNIGSSSMRRGEHDPLFFFFVRLWNEHLSTIWSVLFLVISEMSTWAQFDRFFFFFFAHLVNELLEHTLIQSFCLGSACHLHNLILTLLISICQFGHRTKESAKLIISWPKLLTCVSVNWYRY